MDRRQTETEVWFMVQAVDHATVFQSDCGAWDGVEWGWTTCSTLAEARAVAAECKLGRHQILRRESIPVQII